MADFSAQSQAQGGLSLVFNGEGLHFAFEWKNPFSVGAEFCGITSVCHRRSNMRFHGCQKVAAKSTSYCTAAQQLGVDEEYGSDGLFYNYDEDYEFEGDELSCFRGLVLDISYRPVNVVCWKRAICLEFMEKADVLEYYDQTVNSPSGSFYIPAVLRVQNLLQVVKRRRVRQNLNRKNIFFRDAFVCQYCSSRENLTVDHVLPIARGGKWEWENLVTACAKCNSKKGPKTLEEASMKLIKVPKGPKETEILAIPLTTAAITTLRKRESLPTEWRQYLGLPSES